LLTKRGHSTIAATQLICANEIKSKIDTTSEPNFRLARRVGFAFYFIDTKTIELLIALPFFALLDWDPIFKPARLRHGRSGILSLRRMVDL
jgi:hypothetical protein